MLFPFCLQTFKDSKVEVFNFSAIHLLNDPQGFTEKLFSKLRDSPKSLPFEMKIMVMNVISRVIGIHKLTLLSFYPFLFNYLNPHQQEVTLILTFAAQSTHELIPPEDIEAMVKTIANNFVADHCAPEVITVGLNSIREICSRNPLAMNSDLLKDLTEYKDYKNKGVVMAARSLIQLFRDKNPELLHRRERGKFVSENMKEFKKLQFGESLALESLPGVQVIF
ncbi:SDA1-domain-containing protein [Rozella allomycis CSF55]|uniref:Protein SDA1 n=1 Tax=Rozella allomycis (strain CSF55) TaxID=988480 RepID=A0A4P9YP09_ROZAC|nr:SDA1-domain-containing protein [Rozella allomycis CSF55]